MGNKEFRRQVIRPVEGRVMRKLSFLLFLSICLLLNIKISACDNRKKVEIIEQVSDTIIANSLNYTIIHWFKWSKEIEDYIYKEINNEKIFDDSVNTFSKLKIFSEQENNSIVLSTIPLKHLIIDEKKKIIVGLSDFSRSPYNIVVYDIEGNLLFKRRLTIAEIKLNKEELVFFQSFFSKDYKCLTERMCLYEEDSLFYIGLPCGCPYNKEIEQYYSDKIQVNHYFKDMSISTYNSRYGFKSYSGLFSETEPLYDITMLDSVPILLILNSEHGDKVNIPIVLQPNHQPTDK